MTAEMSSLRVARNYRTVVNFMVTYFQRWAVGGEFYCSKLLLLVRDILNNNFTTKHNLQGVTSMQGIKKLTSTA